MKVEIEIDEDVEVKKVGEVNKNDQIKYDSHHAFYFYGTNATDLRPIAEIGIVLLGSNYLGSSMLKYERDSMDPSMDKAVKEYASKNRFENVFVVKIPLGILEGTNANGEPNIPIPILIRDKYDVYTQKHDNIVPYNFIYGIYNLLTNKFRPNPNYSIKFNPNGMVYTSDQIANNLVLPELSEWRKFAMDRENSDYTFEEMYREDDQKRPFDELIEKYAELGVLEDYRKKGKKGLLGGLFKKK